MSLNDWIAAEQKKQDERKEKNRNREGSMRGVVLCACMHPALHNITIHRHHPPVISLSSSHTEFPCAVLMKSYPTLLHRHPSRHVCEVVVKV
jgi:hypothetical protein